MEGLGVAASIIAVVDLSAKVTSLCLKYAKGVKNAPAEIEHLRQQVTNLRNVTERVQSLLKSANGAQLDNSQSLKQALEDSRSRLDTLGQKLSEGLKSKRRRRYSRRRALMWPFQRDEVEQMICAFQQSNQTISLALQIDQV